MEVWLSQLIFMRTFFPKKGQQKKFIDKILSRVSVKEAATLCNLSERTIRDWRREKFLMDFDALCKICEKSELNLPPGIKLRNDYWYAAKGASKGGKAMWKKYGRIGDPEYRKKKWYEWWEREGKYKSHPLIGNPYSIKEPKESEDLSEFTGIMLGDGGITQYQVTISFHSIDGKKYSEFVTDLIKRLFDIPVGVHCNKNDLSLDLVVSRSELVRFCAEKLGIKQGNKIKQQIDIPDWIKRNKKYAIACLRGLIDTDGCVFTHSYKVKGKIYSYKKISFTSYSDPLRQSVFNILKSNGFNPRFAQRKDVRLDSIKDVQRYFQLVGSHNSRYLKRYLK